MPSSRLLYLMASSAVFLAALVASACGDDDETAATPTAAGPTATPYSLGTTLVIRGQEVALPEGVAYTNQSPECQQEVTASSPDCADDLKLLTRGNSYILFDAGGERVIARRIEPDDEADFRPLLGLISGTTGADSSNEETQSPGP